MVVKFPAKLAPAATTDVAESDGAGDDGVFVYLTGKMNSISSTKIMLGRSLAEAAKKDVLEERYWSFFCSRKNGGAVRKAELHM